MAGKKPIVLDADGFGYQEAAEDEQLQVGNISSGSPAGGAATGLGQGLATSEGMVVITSDNTATSTTEGGNLTDVSAAAASESGSTYSFQGTAAEHTIMFGSEVDDTDTGDKFKHWALYMNQTTAAVEITKRSFIFERWDGAQWASFGVKASSLWTKDYRYANEVFIRANSIENINFGMDQDTTWAKKTILGKNLYWTRVRITSGLTTAPVFEQTLLVPSASTFNYNGVLEFRGLARFKQTLQSAGNVFGESGGVADGSFDVGSGGLPTGWAHQIKNSVMGSNGDAIYYQFVLPRGIDTSFELGFRLYYIPTTATASSVTGIVSCLPVECEGVAEADPTGGIVPVPRTLANTEAVTTNAAQTDTQSFSISDDTKVKTQDFTGFSIANYYEGDVVFVRFETDTLPNPGKMAVVGLEISGVMSSLGERL